MMIIPASLIVSMKSSSEHEFSLDVIIIGGTSKALLAVTFCFPSRSEMRVGLGDTNLILICLSLDFADFDLGLGFGFSSKWGS